MHRITMQILPVPELKAYEATGWRGAERYRAMGKTHAEAMTKCIERMACSHYFRTYTFMREKKCLKCGHLSLDN